MVRRWWNVKLFVRRIEVVVEVEFTSSSTFPFLAEQCKEIKDVAVSRLSHL